MQKTIRILYIAGRELSYPRTQIIIKSLKRCNYELETILPPNKSFKNYPRLLKTFWKSRKWPDVIFVGFYGHFLVPIIRLLTSKPILFDSYTSTYDTVVYDRGNGRTFTPKAWLCLLIDFLSMRLASNIIVESQYLINYYIKKFKIPSQKFIKIFLPVDNDLIFPKTFNKTSNNFIVHFHGEFAPFHGMKYILLAAEKLKGRGITFQIIGRGITYEKDRKLAESLNLDNISFINPVPYASLSDYMSRADICLGSFGDNPRTFHFVTNKVIEGLAAGKPVITCRNEPIRELLVDGESALLINPADTDALAQAITDLKDDRRLREKIEKAGHEIFLKNCTMNIFSERLRQEIETLTNKN